MRVNPVNNKQAKKNPVKKSLTKKSLAQKSVGKRVEQTEQAKGKQAKGLPKDYLFLTGKLAAPQLKQVLEQLSSAKRIGKWQIGQVGITVAALMTTSLVKRRVAPQKGVKRVMVPGRAKPDLAELEAHFGKEVVKGPDDLIDLPQFFGDAPKKLPLRRPGTLLFAEIVDAPHLSVAAIVERAKGLKKQGANVIDIGCLPDTKFPHLGKAVKALKQQGFKVSVDSTNLAELQTGDEAGCDYLLSFSEKTLDTALRLKATPVLIPDPPGDMPSLERAIQRFSKAKRAFFADPILDPIHYGFSESVGRYLELRRKFSKVDIFIGIGNVTELVDADSAGTTMASLAIASELGAKAALVVSVSPHCRRAVAEADKAWRILAAAKKAKRLAVGIDQSLISLHDKAPSVQSPEWLKQMAKAVRDPNFRIFVGEDGIYIFNNKGIKKADEPFALFPHIKNTMRIPDDIGHAFYLGVELARAEIAYKLGKRYVQDEELDWGIASPFAKKPPAWAKTTRRKV